MKYVLFYESADDVLSKAPQHYPAHKARLDDFHAAGTLLMVGTCVVRDYRILEWNESLT